MAEWGVDPPEGSSPGGVNYHQRRQTTYEHYWVKSQVTIPQIVIRRYTYDSLNRLSAASTTGPQWGLSWTYDGFGNRTNQAITKGRAYASATPVSAATNRLTGAVYDANGNLTSGSGLTLVYDTHDISAWIKDNCPKQ